MASQNVIVFGPTGAVASSAALHAQKLGANVYLAMRDTAKSVPNLSPSLEASGSFTRVQADLSDASSIIAAVKESKATTAFVYRIHGPSMKPSFQALKDAGITFVVFLSSNFVQDVKESYVDPTVYIPWLHAQAEIALEEVFGKGNYVAARPAWFASNISQWNRMIKENGEIPVISIKTKVDALAPSDVGKVCGGLVAGGKEKAGGKDFVRICGPELLSIGDVVRILSKAVGKELKVREVSEEEHSEALAKYAGLPEHFARVITATHVRLSQVPAPDEMYGDQYEESAGNILKYGGEEPLKFKEWVDGNKEILA